ncbi:uncharacterized protein PEAK3 [Fukomys damarensis]|uniref:uncharacterized protein PEAK3 n=1 Tax=Fukomys damarensis TaxID=885580 RepID=UPI00053F9BDC|nr:uncharacterized protein PEAK3 [Fukomys damarensis]
MACALSPPPPAVSRPESPAENPEPGSLAQPAQPAYCNLGEVRAHLMPFKACRSHTPRSLSSSGPQPPPLPKKNLTRMHAGHGFRLLERTPCAESEDALYYRVVRMGEDAWHMLAAKVPKPGAEMPREWSLELQASLPPHYNVQGLCGLMPEGALAGAPWTGRVVLAVEVPERTVAQWLAELGVRRSEKLVWAVAFTVLQLSAALELLEKQGAAVTELRPENLLKVRGFSRWYWGVTQPYVTWTRRLTKSTACPLGANTSYHLHEVDTGLPLTALRGQAGANDDHQSANYGMLPTTFTTITQDQGPLLPILPMAPQNSQKSGSPPRTVDS